MLEKEIEAYLVKKVKTAGGIAFKFVSPGNVGVPDRICLLPGGRVVFVELKAGKRTSTDMQTLQQGRIASLGCRVEIVNSREAVDRLLETEKRKSEFESVVRQAHEV